MRSISSRRNVGQIRIIEAFLSALVIFSSLTISSNLPLRQETLAYERFASAGLQALAKIDTDGSLGRYIEAEDWSSLGNTLNLILPAGISFNLTIYNAQMQQVNTQTISNGSSSSQDTIFIRYVCASQSSLFRCYIVHLHLSVIR